MRQTYLGHSNHNDLSVMLIAQVIRQVSSLRVGIVSTNSVNHVNTVLQQLLGTDLEGSGVSGTVALLDAVLNIGKL